MRINEFVNKGYYINLNYKTERNEKTIEELKKYNLLDLVSRFPAIQAFDQTVICEYGSDDWKKCVDGCTQSHLEIIGEAIENNYERILVFEDDIFFYNEGFVHSIDIIESAIDQIKDKDWEILYLGGSLLDQYITQVDRHLIKVEGMNTSHAYILNHNAFKKIKNNYHYAYPMDILLSANLTKKYSVYPVAVTQRGGDVSDIGGHHSFGPTGFINSYLKPIQNLTIKQIS
jgi:GR25 family glycosyltransferase involved in LPS biosynthesis